MFEAVKLSVDLSSDDKIELIVTELCDFFTDSNIEVCVANPWWRHDMEILSALHMWEGFNSRALLLRSLASFVHSPGVQSWYAVRLNKRLNQ